jgi:hypothetical protein
MPPAALAAIVALSLGVAGCGGGDDFANSPRPAAPITLSAAISTARVTVSPSRFGAGAIELIASNQTPTSQRLTLRSTGSTSSTDALEQTTGPINPGDTASLKADLVRGSYLVTARSAAIGPATIVVGPPRPSGADSLLQP